MMTPELAATAIAIETGLIIFMDWVPTPLNRNISGMTNRERIPSSAIHGTLGVLFASANLMHWTWVVLVGALWFGVVLAQGSGTGGSRICSVSTQGKSRRTSTGSTTRGTSDSFQGSVTISVVPDVQHVLIHLSVLGAAMLSWASFVDLR